MSIPHSNVANLASSQLVQADSAIHFVQRRVDAAMEITHLGWKWSVQPLPGVHVGDVVFCHPQAQGDALYVQSENELQPGIWASLSGPARSHLHTCPQPGMRANSGTATTCYAPAHSHSCPGLHAVRTLQQSPAATPAGRKRIRIAGTAAVAPGAGSTPTAQVAAQALCSLPVCHKPGIGKSQNSLNSSIGLGHGVQLCQSKCCSWHFQPGVCLEANAKGAIQ